MKLPVTERGRAAMAWKYLARLVADGERRASITPGEPLSRLACPRRNIQVARMLLDVHHAKRAAARTADTKGQQR